MKKLTILALLISAVSFNAFSQGEIDTETKEFYRNERTLAFEVNSRGWGFGFRYGKRLTAFSKRLFETSFITVKHLREIKVSNETGRFVYGKLNSLYSLQAVTGYQKEHFGKFDKGGVSIRSVFQGGLCLGIVKPYYYIVYDDDGEKVPTQYTLDNTDIYSKAPYFHNIGSSYFLPGVCAKVAVNFEFSKTDLKVKALEFGINGHAYPAVITLMATEDNTWWYVNLFIAYRFGKIVGRKQSKTL